MKTSVKPGKKRKARASEIGPNALALRAAENEMNITHYVAQMMGGGGDLRAL